MRITPAHAGKRGGVTLRGDPAGITPAHAGKRRWRACVNGDGQDHPRPCGEKHMRGRMSIYSQGSPPPMRGKVVSHMYRIVQRRITPAHAGKSPLCAAKNARREDHPRPCGEKTYHPHLHSILLGSPPPMRGKALQWAHICIDTGITPAHAGKSSRAQHNL